VEFNKVRVVYALLMCGSERQKRDGIVKTKSWNATVFGKLVIIKPLKKSQQSTLRKII